MDRDLTPDLTRRASEFEARGREMVASGHPLADIVQMALHPQFEEFFRAYCQTPAECESVLMMINAVYYLRDKMSGRKPNGLELAGMLKSALDDSQTRQSVISKWKAHLTIEDEVIADEADKSGEEKTAQTDEPSGGEASAGHDA